MSHIIGAYWRARPESREACAHRLVAYFSDLSQADTALGHWFKRARSKAAATKPFPVDAAGLLANLKTNNRDVDGEPIQELGFSFGAWTGSQGDLTASIGGTLGGYSPYVGNSVVLAFESTLVSREAMLRSLLEAAVAAFEPDDAVVATSDVFSSHRGLPPWGTPGTLSYRAGKGFFADWAVAVR